MTGAEITLAVIVFLAVIGGLLSWLARRLDALHKRVINSRAVLDAQLVRRAELAMGLASSGVLDDASELIITHTAWEAGVQGARLVGSDPSSEAPTLGELAAMTASGGMDRGDVETNLTIALRTALGDARDMDALARRHGSQGLLENLESACYRVQLARRFHNDAVDAVRSLRRNWLVRTARLAGRASLPTRFEIDDVVFPTGRMG